MEKKIAKLELRTQEYMANKIDELEEEIKVLKDNMSLDLKQRKRLLFKVVSHEARWEELSRFVGVVKDKYAVDHARKIVIKMDKLEKRHKLH